MSVVVEAEQQTLAEAEQAMVAANSRLAELSQQLNTCQEQVSQLEREEGIIPTSSTCIPSPPSHCHVCNN